MYYITVVLFMLVCPLLFAVAEASGAHHSESLLFLIGKWYVFWAVGIRGSSAGLWQALRPQFTAEKIFGIRNPESHAIVREVGFGNLSVGLLGICSLFRAG